MSRRIAAAAGLAARVVGPGVVSANAALSDCKTSTSTNRMCMWGNDDFKWMIGNRQAGYTTIETLSGDADNEMDSWANRSATYTGCMYSSSNGGGDKQVMGKVSNDDDVSPWNSDEVSSWRTKDGC